MNHEYSAIQPLPNDQECRLKIAAKMTCMGFTPKTQTEKRNSVPIVVGKFLCVDILFICAYFCCSSRKDSTNNES